MKKYQNIMLVTAIFLLFVGQAVAQQLDKRIIGYYTSWSVYVRDYHVQDIPPDMITHINYAFANINNVAGTIMLGDPYADIDRFYPGDSWDPDSLRGCFHQLQILKDQHPELKTFISIGGWTWSVYFSDVAFTEQSRQIFAQSCIVFIDQYDFDGIDIDWEYPVSGGEPGNHYHPEDRENYTLLLEELRGQLDSLEQENNREYLLTIAAPANPAIIANIEVELIHQYLDWINIMTFDFHGPWNGPADVVTNFNTPLHIANDDPLDEPYHSTFNLEAAVQAYSDLGVPEDKIQPGLAFYGRGFGNVVNENNGLFASYQGPAPVGTWENGVFDFWDLAQNYIDLNGYTVFRHDEARVPWLYNLSAQVMISYDDSLSIAEKGAFINENNLGGVMFWEFSADRYGVLLTSIYIELFQPTFITNDNGAPIIPGDIILEANYPNPFNAQTIINYLLPKAGRVTIEVFDLLGHKVETLINKQQLPGYHQVLWNADGFSSGVYFYKIQAGDYNEMMKMVLLK